MANQRRSGSNQRITTPLATEHQVRRVPLGIENIFNQAYVDRLFESESIDPSKIIGGGGGGAEDVGTNAILSFPGLVSYWAGTINRSTLVLKDMTTNGVDLTRNGGAAISRYNLAPILTFSDSHWSFVDDARLDLSGNEAIFPSSGTPGTDVMRGITLLAWIRLGQAGNDRAIINKWNQTGSQRSYMMDYIDATATLRFGVSSTGADQIFVSSANNSIVAGTWHFVAGRFTRANEVANFVDGVKATAATAVTSVFGGTAPFRIGEPGVPTDFGWQGDMAYPIIVASSLPDSIIEAYRQRTLWLFE